MSNITRNYTGLQARASSDLGVLYSPLLGGGSHADVRRCVEEAERAYRLAQRFSPPAMRSWAAAQLALAYAVNGQRVEAHKGLSQAGKHLDGDGGEDSLGDRFVGTMDEVILALFEGEGLLALGEAQPAIQRLKEALNSNPSQWATVSAMTTLAEAYTHVGDRQQGMSLLAQARAIATAHDYVLELQRIDA
jgi:tetratricopeptide (TPR) repeat protein